MVIWQAAPLQADGEVAEELTTLPVELADDHVVAYDGIAKAVPIIVNARSLKLCFR